MEKKKSKELTPKQNSEEVEVKLNSSSLALPELHRLLTPLDEDVEQSWTLDSLMGLLGLCGPAPRPRSKSAWNISTNSFCNSSKLSCPFSCQTLVNVNIYMYPHSYYLNFLKVHFFKRD